MGSVDRILVIKGKTQYGQMRFALDEMIEGFLSKGCLVTILDMIYDEGEQLRLRRDFVKDYDLIISMNLIGFDLYLESDCIDKPLFWGYLEDHPFHLHQRLALVKGNVMISCCDKYQVEYLDHYYPNIKWTCFMPHGGIVGSPDSVPFQSRKYGIVFIGSLGNEKELLLSIERLKREYGSIIDLIIEKILADTRLDLATFVEKLVMQGNDSVDISGFPIIMNQFSVLDSYRRYSKRKRLLEVLANDGITVNIWGNGWEGLSEKAQSVHKIMGSVDHNKIAGIMGDSCFVLNDMPVFLDGTHDRVFASMQCGAVSVTDGSLFLEENYTNMKEIVFYDSNHPDKLSSVLCDLMNNMELAENIAHNGYEAACEQTWKNIAKDIIDIAENLDS